MPRIVVRQKLRFKAQFLCKGCLWVGGKHVGHESFLIQQQKCFIFLSSTSDSHRVLKSQDQKLFHAYTQYTLNKYIFHQEVLEWDIEFRPGWEQREKCQVCLHPTTDTWHVIGGSRFWRMDWEQLMCAAFDICHHRNSSFLSPALMLWWNPWQSPMLYP